jgi:hypothetical protein
MKIGGDVNFGFELHIMCCNLNSKIVLNTKMLNEWFVLVAFTYSKDMKSFVYTSKNSVADK